MGKKLSELSLEELWQLFPIQLEEHRDCWADWFREESDFLGEILPPSAVIRHIGSTAVKGIQAKPIVDILVELPHESDFAPATEALCRNGYLCMSQEPWRFSFNKGYTEEGYGEKVFHLHLRRAGDNDELYFRDYLITHPQIAKEYEALKLSLQGPFRHDRDGYTAAKGEFVRKYTALACQELRKEGPYGISF